MTLRTQEQKIEAYNRYLIRKRQEGARYRLKINKEKMLFLRDIPIIRVIEGPIILFDDTD